MIRDIRRWREARGVWMRSGAWRLNHHQTGEDGKQESITISEVHNHLYGAVCSLEHLNFPLRMCQRAKRRYRLQFFMGDVAGWSSGSSSGE